MYIKWYKIEPEENGKNVINETAIKAANFISSIYLLIMIDTLLLRASLHFTTLVDTSLNSIYIFTQLHFSPLHYTCLHFTSSHLNFTQLHFTTLHFTTLSFSLTPLKFPTSPFHLTSLHFTSLHLTALLEDFRNTSILSIHTVYNCFSN